MAYYLLQANYATASIKAMVDKPQDRAAQAQKLIESAGGKQHHFFFALGESDFVILCEMPDDIAVTALSMAVGASSAIHGFKTTKLLTAADAMAAMSKAQSIKYSPPAET